MSYSSPYRGGGGRKRYREDDYTPDKRPFRRQSRGGYRSNQSSNWDSRNGPSQPPMRIKNEAWLMGDRGSRFEDATPHTLDSIKRELLNVWQRSDAGKGEVFELFEAA